jgi:hypothetical protein
LSEGARAVPLMRAPGVAAVLTYRVAWHNEYRRGKQLAALLQSFQPNTRRGAATTLAPAGAALGHLRPVR